MTVKSLPETFISNPNLHAYLVLSPDRTARSESAKAMAAAMICRTSSDNGSFCGKCPDCIKLQAGTHPDCIYVSGATKTSVKDVREIDSEAYLAPNEADCKVFVLENADGYNVESQNALLKIIEEPPKGVKFILTASSRSALLPTVRSRVCSVPVQNRSFDQIFETVKKSRSNLGDSEITSLAHFCNSYDEADAETLNDSCILQAISIADQFLSGKNTSILLTLPKNKEELMLCLQVFMLCCRQIALVKNTGRLEDGILPASLLSSCNAKTSMKRAHALYDVFEESYILAQENVNVEALLAHIIRSAK